MYFYVKKEVFFYKMELVNQKSFGQEILANQISLMI